MAFLSRLPWITKPLVVGAPMRVFASPELAVAVSAAGGLGFIGPGAKTEHMQPDLERARELIRTKYQSLDSVSSTKASGATSSVLPVGVGFQLWSDHLETATRLIEQYRPCAVWLFAPRDERKDIDLWSRSVREAYSDAQVWVQIGTVAEVERLLELSRPPDVIVAQGAEAGGHGRAEDGTGIITLVPEIADLLSQRGSNIPIIAAGGIADGRGAAAAHCLGAKGVALGSRFLAASEARISKGYQQEVVRASDGGPSTTRTLLYNHLRGTFGWPKEYAPRTIINRSFIDHRAGASFESLQVLHDEATAKGDDGWGPEGRLATYAGASVGLIRDVKPAGQIVQDLQREMQSILSRGLDAKI
ncbi:uncharacterized protein HMPREF1541_04894 [Cyphellophora europaea CBS 101466]|uniref:Uncharacterized protein n=1 Tax=Cyphellophora europaea (strain CBS 101466) TaxID=1220924 RepID=W2RVY7_CYPE1|nr:uncharacterized protein HMPREF1541_04894 [Cyphellophora europaea CBS 101466]ETN40617.1 hypothetical protein HMPREF1541_04894 [Cyphellophora europaea CBS 101466]